MNPKKLRVLLILVLLVLIMVTAIAMIYSSAQNHRESQNGNQFVGKDYTYSFEQNVNLNQVNPTEKNVPEYGTAYPSIVTMGDHTEGDIRYEDGKVYISSNEGDEIYSPYWLNEGFAIYVNEPTFGLLYRVVLKHDSMIATYHEVKMKDVISYINELSGLGFNEKIKDEKENKEDYYIYSAKKGERTATLNYQKGTLDIIVY